MTYQCYIVILTGASFSSSTAVCLTFKSPPRLRMTFPWVVTKTTSTMWMVVMYHVTGDGFDESYQDLFQPVEVIVTVTNVDEDR